MKKLLGVLILLIGLYFVSAIPCTENDMGDNPYNFSKATGTYSWNFTTYDVPDQCRLNNNSKVTNCTNCRLTEYYCDGYLYVHVYNNVSCSNGRLVF